VEPVQPWREISRSRVYEHFRRIDQVVYELPDGTRKSFDIEASTGSVTIFALTPDQQVIMVEQYRPGPDKTLTEFPGGIIDDDEEPIVAAGRELLEETGYTGELTFIGLRALEAYSNGVQYGFVATDCRKVAEPQLDEGEFVSVKLVSLEECKRIVRSDYAPGAGMGLLALDHLGLL
jgi:ADP-ribose pyrophosphatase